MYDKNEADLIIHSSQMGAIDDHPEGPRNKRVVWYIAVSESRILTKRTAMFARIEDASRVIQIPNHKNVIYCVEIYCIFVQVSMFFIFRGMREEGVVGVVAERIRMCLMVTVRL